MAGCSGSVCLFWNIAFETDTNNPSKYKLLVPGAGSSKQSSWSLLSHLGV